VTDGGRLITSLALLSASSTSWYQLVGETVRNLATFHVAAVRESPPGTTPATLTESVADLMLDDIVHGRLQPGSKLRIHELKERYSMGASPLREALTRLLALGFVTNESRRGFRVAAVSFEDINEITSVRKLIEQRALQLSIENASRKWEEQIVMQMARLRHAWTHQDPKHHAHDPSSDGMHEDYHRALIANCNSPRLISLQATYYDLAKRYRLLVFQTPTTREEFLTRHEVLTDVVLSRKKKAACEELGRHLELIVSNLPDDFPKGKATTSI